MKKKILFFEIDNLLIKTSELSKSLEFMPGVISSLSRLALEGNYQFVVPAQPDHFDARQEMMFNIFASEGIYFDQISAYNLINDLDYKNSYLLSSRCIDSYLSLNLNIPTISYGNFSEIQEGEVFSTNSWSELVTFLLEGDRKVVVERVTNETNITVELNLNGTGKSKIYTGIGFFNHMLEQIARHGNFDLTINAQGDLYVDQHHTIEDCGIALGNAFKDALGKKWGINRYAFSLPMDESSATILLDLGGRAYLNWNVSFEREYVGDMPTEMIKHFFLSFSQAALCTLHIECRGENNHHKIEALFKAFGKVLKESVAITNKGIPSSKGTI